MRRHLLWVDIAKGIAIASVVLGHCLDDHTALRALVYSFHMPLFFALAGFTLRAKPRREVLVSSLRRLMLPYALVCAVLFLFAFVPPDSINPALVSQRPWDVVLAEIVFASGQEGEFYGFEYEAIGAIWFLPCLFVARLVLNEVLLASGRLARRLPAHGVGPALAVRAFEAVFVAAVVWLGFSLGMHCRLPMDVDTALVAVLFMYAGYALKLVRVERVGGAVWLALIAVWLLYPLAGNGEMAIRAYLEHPWSLATGAAGALVVMRCCVGLEQFGALTRRLPGRLVAGFGRLLAWAGVSSLSIMCVHRVESAVFNWQKIMEAIAPDVWHWTLTQQGLYQFTLRFTLVAALVFVGQLACRMVLGNRVASHA